VAFTAPPLVAWMQIFQIRRMAGNSHPLFYGSPSMAATRLYKTGQADASVVKNCSQQLFVLSFRHST